MAITREKKRHKQLPSSPNKWEGLLSNTKGPGLSILGFCEVTDIVVLNKLSKATSMTIAPEMDLRILRTLRDFALNNWLQTTRKVEIKENGIQRRGQFRESCVKVTNGWGSTIARKELKPAEYIYPNPKQIELITNDTSIDTKERIANLANLLALPLQCDLRTIRADRDFELLLEEPYNMLFSVGIVCNPLIDKYLRNELKDMCKEFSHVIQVKIITLCQESKDENAQIEEIKKEIKFLVRLHRNLPGNYEYSFMYMNTTRLCMTLGQLYDATVRSVYCYLSSINTEVLQLILDLKIASPIFEMAHAIESLNLLLVKHLIALDNNNALNRSDIWFDGVYIQDATTLMRAVRSGHLGIMDEILKIDKDINAIDNRGWTALMHAAYFGHVECVKRLLLDCKADPTIRNSDNLNVLDIATRNGQDNVVKFLNDNVKPALQLTPKISEPVSTFSWAMGSLRNALGF